MNAYPEGYGPDSAAYATDGPREQVLAELRRIAAACAAHSTIESETLGHEASVYLAWLANHQSCRHMPQDWEPGDANDPA